MFDDYPPASSTHKPTLADTACNRHVYSEALLLDDMQEVPPVWINVANNNKSSRIMANSMGTARLHAFAPDGSPSFVEIHNVLYSPSLRANLISITEMYDSGFKLADPYYGRQLNDLNMYF